MNGNDQSPLKSQQSEPITPINASVSKKDQAAIDQASLINCKDKEEQVDQSPTSDINSPNIAPLQNFRSNVLKIIKSSFVIIRIPNEKDKVGVLIEDTLIDLTKKGVENASLKELIELDIKRKSYKLDQSKNTATWFGVFATILAGIMAGLTYNTNNQTAQENIKFNQDNIKLSQKRLISERFAKAVEQIGNDKGEVVIGGIYSLDQIAVDSPDNQWTIIQVLAAFIRQDSLKPSKLPKDKVGLKMESIRRQAAIKILGKINDEYHKNPEDNQKENHRIDLSETNLDDAEISGANLNLANLHRTKLNAAGLDGVQLVNASLRHAKMKETTLEGANLKDADMKMADISMADLTKVDLSKVKNLIPSQIRKACYWDAETYNETRKYQPIEEYKISDYNHRVECDKQWPRSPSNQGLYKEESVKSNKIPKVDVKFKTKK